MTAVQSSVPLVGRPSAAPVPKENIEVVRCDERQSRSSVPKSKRLSLLQVALQLLNYPRRTDGPPHSTKDRT